MLVPDLEELADLPNGGLSSHVVLRSEPLGVLVLLLVLQALDLFFEDFLHSHYVLVAFLVQQPVDLFQQRFLDVRLLLLVDDPGGLRGETLLVGDAGVLGLQLLDVVEDHQAEGEGVQDIQELVAREVHVGWQLQRGDELVLERLPVPIVSVETQGGSQGEEEVPQIVHLDEGRSVRIIDLPGVSEFLIHVYVEEATILSLHVIVPLQNDGDKDLQEDQVHNEHVADKVCIG